MNNQTLEKLRQMRLFGMHDAFKTSLENTIKEKMTQDQFVSHLVHSEWDNRKNRPVEGADSPAQFRYNATLDDLDYTFERGLDRNQVERLAAAGRSTLQSRLLMPLGTATLAGAGRQARLPAFC